MGVCNCSMFCCTLLYVHSSIAIILMGKRELIALLYLSSWCLVMVERLFLAVPRGCLQFVIVVFPDHTQLLFFGCWYDLEDEGSNSKTSYSAVFKVSVDVCFGSTSNDPIPVHIVAVSFSSFNFTVILKLQFLKILRQTIDYSWMSSDCLLNPCNCSTLSSIYFA